MTCYMLVIPYLLLIFYLIHPADFLNHINKLYMFFVILLTVIIYTSELKLYGEWDSKLHYNALTYLENPSLITESVSNFEWLKTLSVLFLSFILVIFIYYRYFHIQFKKSKTRPLLASIYLLVTAFLIFYGIRGGLKLYPISQSESYYSNHIILNDAATNSVWNLMHSIIENSRTSELNPYSFYDINDARKTINSLHNYPVNNFDTILKTAKPNIIMIIVESLSADVIEVLDGEKDIANNINKIISEGLLFTNFYANGYRTHLGHTAIFSGFPGQPVHSIISQTNKVKKIPSIISELKKNGYHTSFYCGSQLSFKNLKAYFLIKQIDCLRDINDFGSQIPRNRGGVLDDFVFERQLTELSKIDTPFFSAIFTSNPHQPYDVPEIVIHGESEQDKYRNAVKYIDNCIGKYFEKCKKQLWFNNTLFVLTADHSIGLPKPRNISEPLRHKIPFVIFGNPLRDDLKGKTSIKIGSQVDIAATLLSQLNIDAKEFKWSKNLFNPDVPEFAYYCYIDALGWVRPQGAFAFNNIYKQYDYFNIVDSTLAENIVIEGKSYLQVLFQEYLEY